MFDGRMRRPAARAERFPAVILLVPAVVLTLLWLPFGFSMIGLIEEWDLLGLFAMHGTFFYTHLDGPLAAHALRPLMPFSFALAHALTPDSFAGWHVVTLTALGIKAAALSWLGWRATGSRAAGVLCGALLLLYPADTMQLSFRSIHIHVAGALALSAAALAVCAFDAPRRRVSIGLGMLAALLFLCAGLIYEVSLTLVAMPAAVLFVRHGYPRPWTPARRVVAMLWVAAPVLYGCYAVWIGTRIASYQGAVTGHGSALHYALSVWRGLFDVGALRALAGGWVDAVRMTTRTFATYGYLIGASIVLLAACAWAAARRPRESATLPARSTLDVATQVRMLLAGAAMLLLGYLPYLTSPAHMAISQRTYLWATPGAVFVWVAIILMIARAARPLGLLLASGLLVAGLGAHLFQFHHYVSLSERQRTLLRAVVDELGPDAASDRRKLVVLDGSSQMGHTWMFHEEELRFMLSHLYGRSMGSAEVCRWPSLEWQRRDGFGRPGTCREEAGAWIFEAPSAASGPGAAKVTPRAPQRIKAADVHLVRIDSEGRAVSSRATASHRDALLASDSTIGRRYRGILEARKHGWFGPMFKDEFPSTSYRFDFGDWWSLEVAPQGAGWRESEWTGNGRRHVSRSWKTGVDASLYFPLASVPGPYRLSGLFDAFANPRVRAQMRATINGQPVALAWTDDGHFAAVVPRGLLVSGRNELIFAAPVDPNFYGLSARIDWVAVDPL